MEARIEPVRPEHFEGLHAALDSIARERRYLAFLQAPSREEAVAFSSNIVAKDLCQFVAILDGEVVGWCDVLPTHGEARAHVGTLGIGVVERARHRGIGAKLMRAAISKAWAQGLTRIELRVRADNANAKAMYERFGFQVEGSCRNAILIDGRYYDCLLMALLHDRSERMA